jgi:hypothetical protein
VKLKPFWNYYGGKFRVAPKYPAPRHPLIVEPFAGAAGYALRHHDRKVLLIDKDPVIAEVWRFLIGASPADVRAIPLAESTADLPDSVRDGARWIVGFNPNFAKATPSTRLSSGSRWNLARGQMMYGWGHERRERVASQVEHIKHWQVMCADYQLAPDVPATWFVDPPYQRAGVHYRHGSKAIDFSHLGEWCRTRQGQTIVCEAEGADWLPFSALGEIKSFGKGGLVKVSREVWWTNE